VPGGRSVAGVLEARIRNRDTGPQPCARTDAAPVNDTGEFAPSGWLVEVRLTIDKGSGFRFFAVGM
jgi:hypothetical protein